MHSTASLPNNVEELKRLLIGRDAMIAKLIAEIAQLKRRQFGRSAEPMDGDLLAQLQLALDDLRVVPEVVEAPIVKVPATESTQPLAAASKQNAIGRYVLAGDKVHGDDTPTPVLDPGRGRTKTGRIWTYVRDDRPAGSSAPAAVRYHYSPDRKGLHPQDHLKHFKGILQADGYAGYGSLYQDGQVTEAACWAHARRKFYDLYATSKSPLAAEAIGRIGVLYAVEREIRGQRPEARLMVRQARSVAVLEALRAWLDTTLVQVSAKSDLGGAIKYALVRWEALTLFSRDGRVEIDNNSAERSIRPVVLGRRNYMFAGSDAGGQRAAIIYSLIGTALLNAVEPYAYLRHVLERIADHPINRIDDLLPWNVQLAPVAERLAA